MCIRDRVGRDPLTHPRQPEVPVEGHLHPGRGAQLVLGQQRLEHRHGRVDTPFAQPVRQQQAGDVHAERDTGGQDLDHSEPSSASRCLRISRAMASWPDPR